jgi:hypothetical protein
MAIINPLPNNIVDGTTADAVPVMANFNWIVSQVNANVAAIGAGFAPLVSPGFSGTPTAPTPANGTNTTQLATTAFVLAELALSLPAAIPGAGIPQSVGGAWGESLSTTGTGNVVLSTSPTLVAPALGTPSALVGTNITGTAAALNIGGTAALATALAAGSIPQLLAANGYQKLPGGVIIQWGISGAVSTGAPNGSVSVTFPTAFPTALGSVLTIANNSPTNLWGAITQYISASSTSGFTAAVNTGNASVNLTNVIDLFWFAIGW